MKTLITVILSMFIVMNSFICLGSDEKKCGNTSEFGAEKTQRTYEYMLKYFALRSLIRRASVAGTLDSVEGEFKKVALVHAKRTAGCTSWKAARKALRYADGKTAKERGCMYANQEAAISAASYAPRTGGGDAEDAAWTAAGMVAAKDGAGREIGEAAGKAALIFGLKNYKALVNDVKGSLTPNPDKIKVSCQRFCKVSLCRFKRELFESQICHQVAAVELFILLGINPVNDCKDIAVLTVLSSLKNSEGLNALQVYERYIANN